MPPAATSNEIRALTGLRGVAALYIVVFHAQILCACPAFLQPFIAHGYMAVDLFFILSGFVMALTCADMFEGGVTLPAIRSFLALRIARIYPLFALITLLTALALARVVPASKLLHDLAFNMVLIHAWGFADSIVLPGWSISAEWAAYLLFPLTVQLAIYSSRRIGVGVAIAAFALLIAAASGPDWLTGQGIEPRVGPLAMSSSFAPGTVLRCLLSFQIGMACFRFRAILTGQSDLAWGAAVLALLAVPRSDLILIPVMAGLIMALSHDCGVLARTLKIPALHWLGVVSYALYLVQDIVLRTIAGSHLARSLPLPGWAWMIIGIGVSLGLAALCHYGFEKKARIRLRTLLAGEPAVPPRGHQGRLITTKDQQESPSEPPESVAANRR